ncbi:MAG: FIST C-terminal domain-containing protein [Burkholderiaceae bacterium]|nr:FIST C-terminal domain-containing protein [Burkholderiaceae bacterium]
MSAYAWGVGCDPDWRVALAQALAQATADSATPAQPGDDRDRLGIVYLTAALGARLDELLAALREATAVEHWVGAVAHGVCAGEREISDEPALALMLADFPRGGVRVFSGREPPPAADERDARGAIRSHTALVHADPATPDLPELVADMATRTATGFLFGGIVASGGSAGATQIADIPLSGGLSGAVFADTVSVLTRVTQGASPIAAEHQISACSSQFITELDDRPALDVLLEDLGVTERVRASRDGDEILQALPADRLGQGLFVGLTSGHPDRGIGFGDYLIRNVVGIDPHNRVIAVAAQPKVGDRAVFCTRDRQAARRDLTRICTELRAQIEEDKLEVRGALYHSCVARGEHLFATSGAELEIIRHNLGEVALIGFHAGGEIARDRIHGHTGVLTLFV